MTILKFLNREPFNSNRSKLASSSLKWAWTRFSKFYLSKFIVYNALAMHLYSLTTHLESDVELKARYRYFLPCFGPPRLYIYINKSFSSWFFYMLIRFEHQITILGDFNIHYRSKYGIFRSTCKHHHDLGFV